jgi:hypothetical protein
VPIRPKSEKLFDGDDKKARFSVRIATFSTPSSLPHRRASFEGVGRGFSLRGPEEAGIFRRIGKQPGITVPPHHPATTDENRSCRSKTNYLEKKNPLFFFPSSGSIYLSTPGSILLSVIALFRACANSLASENASRIAAMQAAEKNIEERLEELHGSFNQLRQSAITEELLDVVTGFEALSKQRRKRRPSTGSPTKAVKRT